MEVMIKRSSRHKVNALFNDLRERIVSGRIAGGESLPDPESLADETGTSVITIKRIMSRLAGEGLVQRVRGRGTFAIDKSVKPLNIAIIDFIFSPDSSDLQKIMGKISMTCTGLLEQSGIIPHHIDYSSLLNPGQIISLLDKIDGLIIGRSHFDERTAELIEGLRIPKVMHSNEYIYEFPGDQVIPDYSSAMPDVARHIIDNNFREIVIILEDHNTARTRRNAFKSALTRSGIPEEWISEFVTQCVGKSDGGYRFASQLLKTSGKRFIFSTSDFVSFGIIDAMHDHNITPGDSIQLLSTDNLEGYGICPYPQPLLSSIDPDRNAIAAKVVKILLEKIRNPDPCHYIVKIPSKLVIRKSAVIKTM